MSSGTATSIQFLLVRWSVGVGCRSFWYSICVKVGQVASLTPGPILPPPSAEAPGPGGPASSPLLFPVDQDQALEQARHWWRKACSQLHCFCRPLRLGGPQAPPGHHGPPEPCLPPAIPPRPLSYRGHSKLPGDPFVYLLLHLTQVPSATKHSPLCSLRMQTSRPHHPVLGRSLPTL